MFEIFLALLKIALVLLSMFELGMAMFIRWRIDDVPLATFHLVFAIFLWTASITIGGECDDDC